MQQITLVHAPSVQHTVDVMTTFNNTNIISPRFYSHDKVITTINRNIVNQDGTDFTIYNLQSEYMGFTCTASDITLSNIGSSNSNGIIIGEAEMPRIANSEEANAYHWYEIFNDNNQSEGWVFSMHQDHMQLISNRLTFSPDYKAYVLSPTQSKTYQSTILPLTMQQEMIRDLRDSEMEVHSFYAKNVVPRVLQLTMQPNTACLLYTHSQFILTPRPDSVKTLFSTIHI